MKQTKSRSYLNRPFGSFRHETLVYGDVHAEICFRLLTSTGCCRIQRLHYRIWSHDFHFPIEYRCPIQRGGFDFKTRREDEIESQKEHLDLT